ncbi:hypothetical protein BC739_009446 [Kutzneria viridogrisea]|uniref:Uncharacterized protein n=1 Tax=Kutzneria viridogrisea TaxID=47990 RepID=A0ABR6BZ56_9PSEU|nr:hypothetical protein [Kutzneria viridogrisea]
MFQTTANYLRNRHLGARMNWSQQDVTGAQELQLPVLADASRHQQSYLKRATPLEHAPHGACGA